MIRGGVAQLGATDPRSPVLVFASDVSFVLPNPSNTAELVHRLKEEIDKLTEEQSNALESAVYVGMTPDEAKEYDERRARILKLIDYLAKLELSQ